MSWSQLNLHTRTDGNGRWLTPISQRPEAQRDVATEAAVGFARGEAVQGVRQLSRNRILVLVVWPLPATLTVAAPGGQFVF